MRASKRGAPKKENLDRSRRCSDFLPRHLIDRGKTCASCHNEAGFPPTVDFVDLTLLDTTEDKPRRSTRSAVLFSVAAGAISFALLPVAYSLIAYGLEFPAQFRGAFAMHVMLNCMANFVVMIGAPRLKDRLDRKIASVLTRVLLAHGILGFWVLVTRQFHSNEVMVFAAMASAVFGCLLMYAKHRTSLERAALIGDRHPLVSQLKVPCDHILSSEEDLRGYDVVLTASVGDLTPEWASAVSKAMMAGIPIRHLAEFVEEDQGIVSIEHFDLDHLPLSGLTSYRARKRLMDVALVMLTAPLTIPLLLGSALLVRTTMGGPVMFIQDRVGLSGGVFRMYKLRTMRPPRDTDAVAQTTTHGDPRITTVGRFLRRSRLDELPQLWNVLKGDMSIIGPRPEWTLLSADYARSLPAYAYRNLVRPGITGWAQVRGGYAGDLAETKTKVGYDLFYIKNLSFSLDIQILLRTVWTLVSGSGAR